jgi:hypothetical protein
VPISDSFNVPWVISALLQIRPQSVLDIGIGTGTYGMLLRQYLEVGAGRLTPAQWVVKIDGVEIFENYRNPVWNYCYNNIIIGDIHAHLSVLQTYDVILLSDVLEHFSKNDGQELINKLMNLSSYIFITSPRVDYPQEDVYGNKYEIHLSSWKKCDFEGYNRIFLNLGICFLVILSKDHRLLQSISFKYIPMLEPDWLRNDRLRFQNLARKLNRFFGKKS